MRKFEIKNFSNKMADCFLIELENELDQTATILVDGNREKAKKAVFNTLVDEIISLGKKLDFIIITHVDDDHLGGILKLFGYADSKRDLRAVKLDAILNETEVIYNYVTRGAINYQQAESLEDLLSRRKLSHSCKMYYETRNKLLNIYRYEKRRYIKIRKSHTFQKAYLTFISPNKEGVNAVIKDYEEKKKQGSKNPDGELVNRYSIVFLLEFWGKSVIFAADAYWDEIQLKLDGIKEMSQVEVIKIPHHGAGDNNKGMVKWAQDKNCKRFILTVPPNSVLHPSEKLISDFQEYNNQERIQIYTDAENVKMKGFVNRKQVIKIL